jgi:hypothetical protein
MLEEILFVVIVLAVAALMVGNVVRTRNEGIHGHAEGHAFDAERPVAAVSLGSRESFSRIPAGPAMPVAAPDAGPARPLAGGSSAARTDSRSLADAAPVPAGSRRRLRDWHVGSRLLLLVIIPLVASAVIALCVSYVIHVLDGAQADPNGSVMAALAIGLMIIVVAPASWLVIAVARSVLLP